MDDKHTPPRFVRSDPYESNWTRGHYPGTNIVAVIATFCPNWNGNGPRQTWRWNIHNGKTFASYRPWTDGYLSLADAQRDADIALANVLFEQKDNPDIPKRIMPAHAFGAKLAEAVQLAVAQHDEEIATQDALSGADKISDAELDQARTVADIALADAVLQLVRGVDDPEEFVTCYERRIRDTFPRESWPTFLED